MPAYVARDVGDPSTIVPLATLRGPSVSARSTEPRNATIPVAGITAPRSRIPVTPLATCSNADDSHRSSEWLCLSHNPGINTTPLRARPWPVAFDKSRHHTMR